ncbi:MAG TPA: hypothetical protein VFJ62_09300 [Usitatibacter sp.]|nr:hypothetical protein [Usitatibacter sp.]
MTVTVQTVVVAAMAGKLAKASEAIATNARKETARECVVQDTVQCSLVPPAGVCLRRELV